MILAAKSGERMALVRETATYGSTADYPCTAGPGSADGLGRIAPARRALGHRRKGPQASNKRGGMSSVRAAFSEDHRARSRRRRSTGTRTIFVQDIRRRTVHPTNTSWASPKSTSRAVEAGTDSTGLGKNAPLAGELARKEGATMAFDYHEHAGRTSGGSFHMHILGEPDHGFI